MIVSSIYHWCIISSSFQFPHVPPTRIETGLYQSTQAINHPAPTTMSRMQLKATEVVLMKDIVRVCQKLSDSEAFQDTCSFTPEGITEGGIRCHFKEGAAPEKAYKSVRLCVGQGTNRSKWPWVDKATAMTDYVDSEIRLFQENEKFTIILKAFYGAPAFTHEELMIWEQCFNEIGVVKIGGKKGFPSKKRLREDACIL